MISKELLDILACPFCKSDIKLTEEGGKEWLKCLNPQCGCIYAIEDNIPIMLIDKANRPCPKCGTQRDWIEEKDTIHCPKCNTELKSRSEQSESNG